MLLPLFVSYPRSQISLPAFHSGNRGGCRLPLSLAHLVAVVDHSQQALCPGSANAVDGETGSWLSHDCLRGSNSIMTATCIGLSNQVHADPPAFVHRLRD